jgi:uncharacterized peroxidase-related enzyme
MTYITPLDPATAEPATAAVLTAIKAKLGIVPNVYATLAKAPTALKGLLQLEQANAGGRLSAAEREIIALAASQANGCQYCLSAHTVLGRNAGLTVEQVHQARAGAGNDARAAAVAGFARALVEHRGNVPVATLDRFKAAGLSEGDLLEIVANVAAMTVTNYVNNVARTEIDFPIVPLQMAA